MSIATVINVIVGNGFIDPCVGVNRAIYTSSLQGAQVMLNLGFAYADGQGARVRITQATPLSRAKFVQQLDMLTVQVEQQVPYQVAPAKNQNITALVWLTVIDPQTNTAVSYVQNPDITYHYVP